MMKTSEQGISLIKQFEGLRLEAYLCPAGVPTIGYGTTKGVKIGDVVTEQEATRLLIEDVARFEEDVTRCVKAEINQNQFDALVSFTYNLGAANLSKSTLLRKLNANPNDPSIANEFMRWVKAGGRTLPGLVRRRQAESELYFK